MKIEGRKRYVKRAVYAACLLNVYDFELEIIEDDSSYLEPLGNNKFLLAIQKDTPKILLIEHIGHELVHLAQYLRGDLSSDGTFVYWKDEQYEDPEHMSDEYFLAPWELEARGLEDWIAHRWRTRSKNELH